VDRRAAREGVVALPRTVPLYAGLFLPRLEPSELALAVSLAGGAGARGVALFSLNTLSAARLSALVSVLLGSRGDAETRKREGR